MATAVCLCAPFPRSDACGTVCALSVQLSWGETHTVPECCTIDAVPCWCTVQSTLKIKKTASRATFAVVCALDRAMLSGAPHKQRTALVVRSDE